MQCFLAELIGTAMLILLGNGVVANVLLERSGMQKGGSVQITFAWGLAVLLPAFIFGRTSGAHLNPALTLALAVLVILDVFNPRIGLLSGLPFLVLFSAACLVSIVTAAVLYADWRRGR